MPNYNPGWNGKSRSRKLNSGDSDHSVPDAIFGEPNSEGELWLQSFLSGASRLMAGYYNARDTTAFARDYINNNPEVSWNDIKYAARTPFWSAYSGLGSSLGGVSKTLLRLYF